MEEYSIASEAAMVAFGKEFSTRLGAGAVIALVGDLGTGKTHFSKGVCEALGYGHVSSPTFTLVNEHLGGVLPVYHFDFYRIKQVEELYDLGWEDYLEKGGAVIAEWADLYAELFPSETVWIKITHTQEFGARRLLVKAPED